MALVVVAVLASLAGALGQIACGTPNPAAGTCLCNGTLYNMSNFHNAEGSTQFVAANGDYRYFFDMIGAGLPPNSSGCNFPPAMSTGNAVGQGDNSSACFPLGSVAQQLWTLIPAEGSRPQILEIIFLGGQDGRRSTISIACEPTVSAAGFMALGEVVPLTYAFAAASCAACPGADPCRAQPPPPPPPPPTNACKAGVTSEPWGNLYGGIQGFGQGPQPTASQCGLQYRVFAYQGVAGPAISHDDNVFTANTNGVLLTHRDAPVHYYKYDGNVVSNVALLNGVFHVVTANQSATYLHVHTLAGQDADTAVLLSTSRPTGNVTVLANPSTSGVYVHADATLYHVVFGKIQSNFTLPAPVHRACIALTRDASILVLSTPTASYGLDPQTTKVLWTLTQLPAAGCPLVFDNSAVFYNASSFGLVDITVGLVAVTLPQPNGCVGQAAFATNCWLVCPTSESGISAFDADTRTTKWTVDLGAPVAAVVADNSTAVIALSTSPDTQTVRVASLDINTGTPRWTTRLPGRGGSIGFDKHGGVIVFTLGSTQSYIYGFGPHGEGSQCPV